MAHNDLFTLLGKDSPAPILGVIVGSDMTKPVCKVRFADGADMGACVAWLKSKFIAWSGRKEQLLSVNQDNAAFTVEIKG
jgi:hypothetical protein